MFAFLADLDFNNTFYSDNKVVYDREEDKHLLKGGRN